MISHPILNHRRISAYERLSNEMAALTYVLRHAKPGGALGPSTIRTCNGMIQAANRLYRREAGMPRFRFVVEDEPFTQADLAILIARLSAAGLTFEERYAHYTEDGFRNVPRPDPEDDDDLPSKHL